MAFRRSCRMRTKWPHDDDRDRCDFFSRNLEFDTNLIFRVRALFFLPTHFSISRIPFFFSFCRCFLLLLSSRMHTQHSHCVGANGRWDIILGWAAFRASTLVGFPFFMFRGCIHWWFTFCLVWFSFEYLMFDGMPGT